MVKCILDINFGVIGGVVMEGLRVFPFVLM